MRLPLSPALIGALLAAMAAVAAAAIITWFQFTQVAVAPSENSPAGFRPLVVESHEVIDIQSGSADGLKSFYPGMRSVPIVVV